MKFTSKAAFGSLCAAVATTGALALPAAGQAAVPGDLCILSRNTTIQVTVFTSYPALQGQTVRITDYAGAGSYKGHLDSRSDGTFPRANVVQSSCH